jgi:hypothetical protein
MKETQIEQRLKAGLEKHGFKVLKLTCPGTNGVPDRMILRPTWSPGPPWFIELKAPKQHLRRLQDIVCAEWRTRGAQVLLPVNTYESVDELVTELYTECRRTAPLRTPQELWNLL